MLTRSVTISKKQWEKEVTSKYLISAAAKQLYLIIKIFMIWWYVS